MHFMRLHYPQSWKRYVCSPCASGRRCAKYQMSLTIRIKTAWLIVKLLAVAQTAIAAVGSKGLSPSIGVAHVRLVIVIPLRLFLKLLGGVDERIPRVDGTCRSWIVGIGPSRSSWSRCHFCSLANREGGAVLRPNVFEK